MAVAWRLCVCLVVLVALPTAWSIERGGSLPDLGESDLRDSGLSSFRPGSPQVSTGKDKESEHKKFWGSVTPYLDLRNPMQDQGRRVDYKWADSTLTQRNRVVAKASPRQNLAANEHATSWLGQAERSLRSTQASLDQGHREAAECLRKARSAAQLLAHPRARRPGAVDWHSILARLREVHDSFGFRHRVTLHHMEDQFWGTFDALRNAMYHKRVLSRPVMQRARRVADAFKAQKNERKPALREEGDDALAELAERIREIERRIAQGRQEPKHDRPPGPGGGGGSSVAATKATSNIDWAAPKSELPGSITNSFGHFFTR